METLRFLMAATFYPPYHLGGDAVHVQYLAEALAARGHEVHVEFSPAAFRLKGEGRPSHGDPGPGVRLHPIPSPFGRAQPGSAYLFGRSRGVSRFHARLLREIRPDVVHLHNISLLGLGLLRPGTGALTVYTAHDYWVRCPRNDLLKYGRRPCETPRCFSCCLMSRRPPPLWRYATRWRGPQGLDLAIAPSRFMAGAVAAHLACPVVHIPNFAPDPNPGGALSEPEGGFLFVGSLEPHKGVPELADAARRGGFPIVFVGRGSLAGRLRELQERGHANLDVRGWLSRTELQPLYARARALVLPSMCLENAPLVALEALAWGTPLLVSRRGGLEEILHDGGAGRSFPPTADSLLDAVREFEREGLDRRLRPSAREAFVRYHRPDGYLERYLGAVRDPGRAVDLRAEEPMATFRTGSDVAESLAGSGSP